MFFAIGQYFYNMFFGRGSAKYITFRKAVLRRDKYTCRKCKSKKFLEVHHIKPWAKFKKLRFKVSNGITLCRSCHAKVDKSRRYFLSKNKFKKT